MMKKLLLLLTVAIAMLALPLAAHADKTKWTNPNYDFNKLHRINLVSISVVDPVSDAEIRSRRGEYEPEAAKPSESEGEGQARACAWRCDLPKGRQGHADQE